MNRRRRFLLTAGLLTAASLTASVVPTASAEDPASAHLLRPLAGPDSGTFPGAEVALGDVDNRGPGLAPRPAAVKAVQALGDGLSVSWNQYGTPRSLTRPGGWLATGLPGTPEQAARGFLKAHSALVGLTPEQVDALELVYDQPLEGSPASVVLLRQRVGDLALAEDGLVSVGLRDGNVASLTSSAVGEQTLNTTRHVLGAREGVLAAAKEVGVSTLRLDDLELGKVDAAGFQLVNATGLAQQQRARLRALPTTDRGLRLVWETAIQDVAGGRALAAISFVDAVTGEVLLRRDAVDTAAAGTAAIPSMRAVSMQAAPGGGTVTGAFSADACSEPAPLTVPEGTQSISLVVSAVLPANDITFTIRRNGEVMFDYDLLFGSEAAQAPVEPAATGSDEFTLEVCPYDDLSSAPYDFVAAYVTSESTTGTGSLPGLPNLPLPNDALMGPPTWRAFGSNPTLPTGPTASPDDRELVCGTSPGATGAKDLTACDVFTYSDGSLLPYDVEATTGLPTFATIGNNAVTSNAQMSTSLTPGPPALPVVSPTRDYAPAFTDAWHTSGCDPLQTVGRADVDASITNLFVGHNRVHDFAYLLGLVEQTGALQVNNFGKGGAEGDPELGNAQNAAATNPVFPVSNQATTPTAGLGLTGRNNANQITLQDGVPGITNQYLFEPIVGFFGTCTDGGLDGSIFLHEYTHAISNRLVGGPDTTLSGQQAGSMGESWSDLVAIEYLQAFDLAGKRGEDPYAVGAYATGDKEEGIRNFNARPSKTPLNYSDIGYDALGPQVHADGEIWSAVQMTVREALMKKYDSRFPSSDKALQQQCATGRTATGEATSTFEGCPGNRRWVTYLFDAMLLQANGSPTMVDMKDQMLAADMLRSGGADQAVIADAYASRGLGRSSAAEDTADVEPTPGFDSPNAARNADVTFRLLDATTGAPVKGSVHVGVFHARTRPIATTLGGDAPDARAPMVAETYDFVVQAAGYGLQRFSATFAPGARTQELRLETNVASAAKGAKVSGDGGVRLEAVIDDDEGTNGGFDGSADETPVAGRTITVDLAGGLNEVSKVAVSALHRPVDPEVEGDFQSRLTGLRAFDLQASKDGGQTFTTVYRSPDDFFPAKAPRATAPDINLRTVSLPTPVVADTLRLVARSNPCTGAPGFQGVGKNAVAEALLGTDCTATANAFQLTVAELQAFGTAATTAPAPAAPAAPAPVASGDRLPATGGSIGIGALALVLLAGAGFAMRRRQAG